MVNPIPPGCDDGEVSHVKHDQVLAKSKEKLLHKSLLFVVLAVVVICTVHMPGSLDKPLSNSTSNLFGEQLLLKLCGKKDDPMPPLPLPPPPTPSFTEIPFATWQEEIVIATGETKRYKSTLMSTIQPAIDVTYTAGTSRITAFLSLTTDQPAAGTGNAPTKCSYSGGPSTSGCSIDQQPQGTMVYGWLVNTGGADNTINIRFY